VSGDDTWTPLPGSEGEFIQQELGKVFPRSYVKGVRRGGIRNYPGNRHVDYERFSNLQVPRGEVAFFLMKGPGQLGERLEKCHQKSTRISNLIGGRSRRRKNKPTREEGEMGGNLVTLAAGDQAIGGGELVSQKKERRFSVSRPREEKKRRRRSKASAVRGGG